MGAGQSTANDAHPPGRALHVLRVTPSSPASQANIEAFFDFVVGFEGDSLASRKALDASELERLVESHEGKSLKLLVWNSKTQDTRVVPITPSREWSALSPTAINPREPESEPQPSLLGLSMRMCEPEFAVDNVWHVLDVLEGSPAESAGLVPYGDWIIGWSGGVLSAEGDFYDVVEAHVDKPLRVYVYSYDFDTIREVVLVPNRQWGGEGLLGCVFGFGLLHRIPPVSGDRQPGSLPPELVEPTEYEEQELFVPADASSDRLEFDLPAHRQQSDAHSHDYVPPAADYTYSYSNRGAAYSVSSIPEEQDDHEANGHAHHDHDHSHFGHDHGHDHGHAHDHEHDHEHDHHDHAHDHGHDHSHGHSHDHHSHSHDYAHSEDSDDELERLRNTSASTPRPDLARPPSLRGLYPNGLRFPTTPGGRPSLSDAGSFRLASWVNAVEDARDRERETSEDSQGLESVASTDFGSEIASDYGSLTSVE
ncbi:unnamed protein product [Peniophora sp. CBMAI 1063]|nr:unnamed protein product [Peniophora sp. CBMAI 1063]